jgi:peptidoglycan hydrolase-like protein with peptidoglycan-binding domain
MRCAVAGTALVVALAAVPHATADSSLTLRLGSRGAAVARWQQILDEWLGVSGSRFARGFERAHARVSQDGVFGRETEAATRGFQRESRIAVTGAVGARTRLAWVEANVTCCGAGYPRVGPGHVSGSVGWWQIALDRWLMRSRAARQLLVDGVFGPATRAATVAFQRAVGVRATGVAGSASWQAMVRRDLVHLP